MSVVQTLLDMCNQLYRLDKIRDDITELGDVAISVETDVITIEQVKVYTVLKHKLCAMNNLLDFKNHLSSLIPNVGLSSHPQTTFGDLGEP